MNNQNEQNKIVLFPGMIEKIIERAFEAADMAKYAEANELFEQAVNYGARDEYLLSVYAHSLYETNEFARAKEVCEQLLEMKPQYYFEAMELYLTICMQLKEFQQVEKLIDTLFFEEIIPFEERERFERIQQINEDLAMKHEYAEDHSQQQDEFDLKDTEFLQLPVHSQLLQIQQLSELNIRPYKEEFKRLIENNSIHPFIKSLLLILLVEQEVNITITIEKFGNTKNVNPAQLELPTKMSQYLEVFDELMGRFELNPSAQEMLIQVLSKHAIVAYPFEWKPFSNEEVVEGYELYMKMMFGDEGNEDYAIMKWIEELEILGELH